MKPLFLSLILASASPVALAQQGDAGAIRTLTATEQASMAGATVKAPLPNAIEQAVMADWFETEFGDDIDKSVSEAARRAYVQTMFEPVWTREGAKSLQDVSADLFKHGLAADEVLEEDLNRLIDQRFSSSDKDAQAKADLALSAAWLRIAALSAADLRMKAKLRSRGSPPPIMPLSLKS